jgi:2-polyprenyl-3-methyl-5-hydroxy-6-metoxy-1,4-benzoquinol methylase
MTLWDDYFNQTKLEQWLYGASSLNGKTRSWLVNRLKEDLRVKTLVDLGCGGGVTAYQLEACGLLDRISYVGVDFSDCMLTLARKKVTHPNVTWEKSALVGYSPGRTYDVVLLRAVIEHILDPRPVLASACKLVANGCLYIIFWNNPSKYMPVIKILKGGFYDISHSEKMLKSTITECGMKVSDEIAIEEKSENSDTRTVWVIKQS